MCSRPCHALAVTEPMRAQSPGRVNLIGDHTDYCGGLALPVAVDLCTEADFEPDGSERIVVRSTIDSRPAIVPLGATAQGGAGSLPGWARLAAAVVALVRPPSGGTCEVRSTVPVGAGLSSSAAFTVALALALGASADPLGLASLCQQAEDAVGSPVGLMDPLVIAAARAGHALLIDFNTLQVEHVPIPGGVDLVVVHSGTARRLADTPYAERRVECAAAAARLGMPLGMANEEDLRALSGTVRARARHVVTECRRVRSLAAALAAADCVAAGRLMTESQQSLAGDFAASTPVVDALVAELLAQPGVFGARMTGGGFGGCVVALAAPGALDPDQWPGRAWVVRSAGGATRTSPSDGLAGEDVSFPDALVVPDAAFAPVAPQLSGENGAAPAGGTTPDAADSHT